MSPYWLLVLLCSSPLWQSEGVKGWGISTVPSESECRPYIEKALKEQQPETPQEAVDATGSDHETPPSPSTEQEGSIEETEEATTKESAEGEPGDEPQTETEGGSAEGSTEESADEVQRADTEATSGEETVTDESAASAETTESQEVTPEEEKGEDVSGEISSGTEETTADPQDGSESIETDETVEATSTEETKEGDGESAETPDEVTTEDKTEEEEALSTEQTQESTEQGGESLTESEEQQEETKEEVESAEQNPEETKESEETTETTPTEENVESEEEAENTGGEVADSVEASESAETQKEDTAESAEAGAEEVVTESVEETAETTEASIEETPGSVEETADDATPTSAEEASEGTAEEGSTEETKESVEEAETESSAETPEGGASEASEDTEASADGEIPAEEAPAEETPLEETPVEETLLEETPVVETPVEETPVEAENASETIEATPTTEGASETEAQTGEQEQPAEPEETVKEVAATIEDQLSLEFEVPKVRRSREHIAEILKLTPESAEVEMLLAKTIENTLKELKKLYDTAIKPLEILYKYRDLSNRHFGDPEIFSKPLILFMGPWSGGKSSLINYLLDNEFQTSSLRTGAEPSPAYFNILMWGEREEVLDGTQLAADWTFSGLQKFGQGLLDRLRGLKLNNPILEKVNIVEIPGILEIRKQVERLFPFNDACQWFIDRADIIFLVYDPSKLDVGPETEAILDQLKGREYQTRILLNKADQVKPEELMRVQGTLIWNISPLMSSQEPPILYSTSLWSVPYEQGAPTRLLHAQERAFLRDLRTAVDKRVENKIASARRFAVRVRNHAKMVDCYLTTYYNHKSFFGNRKKVADDIIEHPQNYHIYEGLSTLTNISRYDLPDPEVYRDFFRLNAVYDFQRLSDTCTYFRGCPINRLDVAIAYDLPELVGKYKKQAERVLEAAAAQAAKS